MTNIKIKFKTNSELQAEIGLRLRRLRLQNNMPRAELAEKAGVSAGSIAKAEAGEDIRLSTLIALLRVLGGLDRVLQLIPAPLVSPLNAVDLGHERRNARRFGKKENTIKDQQ